MTQKLTERQVAVMRRARSSTSAACTTALTPSGMNVAQTGAACRQLERRGFMARQPNYRQAWQITTSGIQWLRSLDAGRPWMVRQALSAAPGEAGE